MKTQAPELLQTIEAAEARGNLQASTVSNIKTWIEADFLPEWAQEAIETLVQEKAWDELNDRFYKQLAFGTGGMRGRTIGKVHTASEMGAASEGGTPEHPAVGTNYLNDFNIIRGTIGLFRYSKAHLEKNNKDAKPSLIIAHDVRHFSRHFCMLAASTWTRLGGRAFVFEGPRSTPQLSFSVRHFKATAGVVITASHNPPHDNGFKVYFEDGAQVVSPHAEGIIQEVQKTSLQDIPKYLDIQETGIETIPTEQEEAYWDAIKTVLINKRAFEETKLKAVFSPIHGTGHLAAVPILKEVGVDVQTVDEQMVMDPCFSTVKSPNPENAEALTLALAKAEETQADIVIATDPDADRIGAAVRNKTGEMVLLSGNVTGSLLAEYRLSQMKQEGWLPQKGSPNACIITTFVTTPLQEVIGKAHGVKVISTLTGFKWICKKLNQYEKKLTQAISNEGEDSGYDRMDPENKRNLLLSNSTFFVFGTEESYGYLGSDAVRDKDGNGAALMFCEMAAYLKGQGLSVLDYLDSLYLKYGYYAEHLCNLYYEGASGAAKIQNILKSYAENPPKEINGISVASIRNFSKDKLYDADQDLIAKENFFFIELENGYKYAVRGSGTEPKIKFYTFGRAAVSGPEALDAVKASTQEELARLEKAIEADARKRAEA